MAYRVGQEFVTQLTFSEISNKKNTSSNESNPLFLNHELSKQKRAHQAGWAVTYEARIQLGPNIGFWVFGSLTNSQ